MPNQLFRPWRTKPGWHIVTAAPEPLAQRTLQPHCALNPTAVWSHPRHRERTKRVHMSACKQHERTGWVWERCTPRNAHPGAPSCPHSHPSSRAPRVPEPPSLTRPPGNFPGAQLVPSARSQRLGVLRHSAPLRPRPGSAQLCPAARRAPCAPCGVRAAGAAARAAWEPGTRRARCGRELRGRGCCRLAALRGPRREGGAPEGGGSSAERRDGGGRGSARRGVGEPGARFLEGGVTRAGANLYSGAGLRRRRQSALYTPNLRSEAT